MDGGEGGVTSAGKLPGFVELWEGIGETGDGRREKTKP